MEYVIVIEDAGTNLGAYAPDVPGCVATGQSIEEVTTEMREALAFHFEGLVEKGEPIPPPTSRVATVDVAMPAGATPAPAAHAR